MEWPRKILIGSVVLNVGLGIAWAMVSRPITPAPGEVPVRVQRSAAPVAGAMGTDTNHAVSVAESHKFNFEWAQLESDDYKQYIANLRSVGCPELTIYDIIIAELDNLYEPKLNALKGANIPMQHKFWTAAQPAKPPRDAATDKEIKRLEDERRALVKELLGVTEKVWRTTHNYYQDDAQGRHAFLSPDKLEQMHQLEAKYEKLGGAMAKETGYKNEAAREQMRAEMKTFMTPEEIFEYEIRTSNLAKQTRSSLRGVEVSEAEYRAVFAAAYEAKHAAPAGEAGEKTDIQRMLDAQAKAQGALKTVLGEERVKELERNRDFSYRQLISAAPYLGFDKAAAAKVQNYKSDTETAARTLLGNTELSAEQKSKALAEMSAAAEKAVRAELGEKGFKYYQQTGGQWLRNPGVSTPRALR